MGKKKIIGSQKFERAVDGMNHQAETESKLVFLELPIHLLYDILSRLPFEAIFSCRCVCQKFLNLLNDPYFAELHTTIIVQDKVNASDLFLAQFGYNSCTCVALTLPKTVFKMRDSNPTTTLIGSCNGLLCIRYASIYYICNPILGEFMVLPNETPSNLQPSAFGFCPKTKQYKVIRFVVESLHCRIYTLGTSNWRKIDNIPPPKTQWSLDSSVNGNFHWITKCKTTSNLICSFNLETEQFSYVSPPVHMNQDMINRTSYISVGALVGLFALSYVVDNNRFEIWVMKNYGRTESWSKRISIDIMSKNIIESSILNHPMTFLNNGDLLIKCDKTSSIYSYSIDKEELRVLMNTGINFMSVIVHRPSFNSLKKYAAGETVEVVRRIKASVQKGVDVKRGYYPSNSSRQSNNRLS